MTPVQTTVSRTILALIGMFAFAFALVPLYDVFCQVTGLNGKVDNTAKAILSEEVDASRYINVQFVTRSGSGLPWRLDVENRQVQVHPGQATEVDFTFSNLGGKTITGRAIPSVSPSEASPYLRKVQCFCFEEQRLEAGERVTMPLVFQLTRDLPANVHTVTLVYTLYPVADEQSQRQAARTPVSGGEA